MAKIDIQRRADVAPPIVNGEFIPVASVVTVNNLTVTSPYQGDFQIAGAGRLIVGENVDYGARVIVSQNGVHGWNNNSVNTFAVWTRTVAEPGGVTHAPGDMHLGNLSANYLKYDQALGTLGLYTPQGAGFIVQRDGSLQAGHAEGAHMLWNAAGEALQIKRGPDVKVQIDANGDAFFDGTILASGGRIYGLMVVDDVFRVGDADGPAVYVGKFVRETATGTIETSEIIATDESNLPWFHVVAGGETLPGFFHLGGTGDYDQKLEYDGATLTLDGTVYARAGSFTGAITAASGTIGGWAINTNNLAASDGSVLLKSPGGVVFDSIIGKYDGPGISWTNGGTTHFQIGTQVDLGAVTATKINSPVVALALASEDDITLTPGSSSGVKVNGVSYIGDGGSTNYTQFDATGHQTMTGTAKPWNDMLIEPVARTTGTNAPTFEKWFDDTGGTSRGIYLYSFDDAASNAEKEVFFNMQMSHAWDGGPIYFHVHWIGAVDDADAGSTPRWGLEYAWKEPGGTYGDTTIVYATGNHLSESVVANKHYITIFSAITPGSTADDLSSVLIGRLFRNSSDAADTYNATGAKCGLLYIDAHYQLARIGSNNEYTA